MVVLGIMVDNVIKGIILLCMLVIVLVLLVKDYLMLIT